MSYKAKIYKDTGGDRQRVLSGGVLDVQSGGKIGRVCDVGFTIGAEAANVINVALQLKDANGDDLNERANVAAYLSADANGDAIAATAPDGGVAVGTDGLAIPVVASKAFLLTSESDGDVDLNLTHAAGALTLYLIVVLPTGVLKASGAITFAA
jgi:hypothetical protein